MRVLRVASIQIFFSIFIVYVITMN